MQADQPKYEANDPALLNNCQLISACDRILHEDNIKSIETKDEQPA
jgi:hypothetical protein